MVPSLMLAAAFTFQFTEVYVGEGR